MFHVKHSLYCFMSEVYLYYACPYNYVDRPQTSAVLEADSTKEGPLQIVELNDKEANFREIKLNVSEHIASSARYCSIVNYDGVVAYYLVLGYQMLNKSVCSFIIRFDPFLSGTYNQFNISGIITRQTPGEMNSFNTIEEPFTPVNPMKEYIRNTSFPAIQGNSINYIASTVDLDKVPETLSTLAVEYDEKGQMKTLSRKYSPLETPQPTSISGSGKTTGGYGIYCLTGSYTTASQLATLNAAGLASGCVLGRWEIPTEYISQGTGGGYVKNLIPKHEQLDVELQTTAEANSYKPKNAKALYLYAVLNARSNLGASEAQFRWCDIASPSDKHKTSFYTDANLLDGGCPYLIPEYLNNTEAFSIGLCYTLHGAEWIKPGLSFEGSSGMIQNAYKTAERLNNITRADRMNDIGLLTGITADVASGINVSTNTELWGLNLDTMQEIPGRTTADVSVSGNPAGRLMTWMHNTLDAKNGITKAGFEQKMANSLYTPTYIAGNNPGLGLRYPNNFCITIKNLSVDDMKRFDKFLTAYGWATCEFVTPEEFSIAKNGINFCYLKMSGVQITGSSNFNNPASSIIKEDLENGIRFWKVAGKIKVSNIYEQANTNFEW